jgi:hypothetical protein
MSKPSVQSVPTMAVDFDRCACCPASVSYQRYTDLVWRLGDDDDFLRLGSNVFLQDVRRYLTSSLLRDLLARHVARALTAYRPDVVIAHSLGSAVAVEALALLGAGQLPASDEFTPPRLLITAGAPLGRGRFLEAQSPRARSWVRNPGVDWLNLVDLTDEVVGGAAPPRQLYATTRHVVVNNDHVVNRLFSVTDSLFGPEAGIRSNHRVQHYLNHPPVVEALADASKSKDESLGR